MSSAFVFNPVKAEALPGQLRLQQMWMKFSSSQHWLEEVLLYSVTILRKAALSCFPASEDASFFSHCAALAVFCAILRDAIRLGFSFVSVQVISGFFLGMHVHLNGPSFQMGACFYVIPFLTLSLVCAVSTGSLYSSSS